MGNVVVAVDLDGHEGSVRRSACALLAVAARLGTPVAAVVREPGDGTISFLGECGAVAICHRGPWPGSKTGSVPGEVRGDTASDISGEVGGWAFGDISGEVRGGASGDISGDLPGDLSSQMADLLTVLALRTPSPTAILLPATRRGHETAARVAVRLDTGLITNAVAVRPGPTGPIAVQRCLADSHEVQSSVTRGVPVITVAVAAGTGLARSEPTTPLVEAITIPERPGPGPGVELIGSAPSFRTHRPNLDTADIVVAGGRGMGSAAAFRLIEDVAAALGGVAAGTHTAADLGWCHRDRHVGLTGRTVRPRLYLASGVSGSVRHRAAIQAAQTVVAIDTDPSAPLFQRADLAVVGDATRILPALLAELRRRGGPGAQSRTWSPDPQATTDQASQQG